MKKTAIVVEGQTEQIFVVRLIEALAQQAKYQIESKRIGGGGRREFYEMRIDDRSTSDAPEFYFLVLDCSGDGKVLPYLLEQYEGLIESDFSCVIGIRDLYPIPRERLEQLLDSVSAELPTHPVKPLFIVAVMEVEAWFIAEHTHFQRIEQSLTVEFILDNLGIDIRSDAEALPHPAADLNSIYELVGRTYDKRKMTVEELVQNIDFGAYSFDALERASRMGPLFDCLSNILAPSEPADSAA